MFNIVVIAATGGVGRHQRHRSLVAGQNVKAVVRDPAGSGTHRRASSAAIWPPPGRRARGRHRGRRRRAVRARRSLRRPGRDRIARHCRPRWRATVVPTRTKRCVIRWTASSARPAFSDLPSLPVGGLRRRLCPLRRSARRKSRLCRRCRWQGRHQHVADVMSSRTRPVRRSSGGEQGGPTRRRGTCRRGSPGRSASGHPARRPS
jgi:hypothetical protein